ncbi:MAG: hypothetical protein AB7I33_11820 [Gemmatimonadales bacterium]
MTAQTLRHQANDPREPVVHELPPLRFDGASISIKLTIHQADDGMWRGRLHFLDLAANLERDTAEILCGVSQQDLWESVRDLREHHLRDLYRSLL